MFLSNVNGDMFPILDELCLPNYYSLIICVLEWDTTLILSALNLLKSILLLVDNLSTVDILICGPLSY